MDESLLSREIIYSNPSLINKRELLFDSFKVDPSLIIFFKDDDLRNNSFSAVKRGYVASEDDLLFNPQLGEINEIMWKAVSNNPKLVKYSKANCYYPSDLLDYVFSNYSLSLNDLYLNPDLCGNVCIMKRFPEFRLYSSDLSNSDKINAIIECINNNVSIDFLPFFDYHFGSNVNVLGLSKLLDFLYIDFDQSDINFQEYCSFILDKIINGVIDIRYYNNKASFKFPNIACMNDEILKVFDSADSSLLGIYSLIDDIKNYTSGCLDYDFISKSIFNFYSIYLSNGVISLSDTSGFCNTVLNMHRDLYYKNNRDKIISYLSSVFNLSFKKKESILNKRKLDKVSFSIVNKDFSSLGIDEGIYNDYINVLKHEILSNKKVKKYFINSELFDSFVSIFNEKGIISCSDVQCISDVSDEIANYICNKFNRFRFKFISSINLSDDEKVVSSFFKSKVSGLNYNNYLIFDRDRYINNIARILISIDDKVLNKINFKSLNDELVYLIPFIGLLPELSIDGFINIISQYDIVNNKICSTYKKSNFSFFDYIDDFVLLSNSYSSMDDIDVFALGQDISSIVGECNVKDYLSFYLYMLKRTNCFIPNVSFKYKGLTYSSGYYCDPDRLLIGHKVSAYSCIHLGSDTFDEVLLGNFGNVILIKDCSDNLISRLLIFRRGNIIQIVSNVANKFPIEVFEHICSQIVSEANRFGDNIDFVIANCSSCSTRNHGYDVITDNRFITNFPHADFYNSGIVLFSRSDDISIDFAVRPKHFYDKQRLEINYMPNDISITRLRALDIVLSNDPLSKKFKIMNFEPFYSKEYKRVICGEDWYVAYGHDGSIEKLALPNCCDESFIEMNSVFDKYNDFCKYK